jgi:lambda family phage portal protein
VLDVWRQRVARWIAPPGKVATRSYASARASRLSTFGSMSNSSADSELSLSLTSLRTRSRSLMRDAPYAKRARVIVVNNVVGSGVGMQCQVRSTRGELHARINADIEAVWSEWSKADACHTGGALAFSDFERACLSEVFTAGEVFIRLHRRPFGQSAVPFALELIEAERVADEFSRPQPGPSDPQRDVRMGVELDLYGRPVAYWIRERHPGELRFDMTQVTRLERVPAADILHLRIVDRWPMTRGEPWLHSVIRKLGDMDEYSSSELIAAKMSANFFATIETANEDPMATTTEASSGQRQMNIEPGVIEQLAPGDELKFHSPNRPNTALDPFLRYMLREVAAGVGCSYESLSRDYSQSNYSSSRLALLDDRDLWRVLQQWWGRSFRAPLYGQWLQAAVLSRAVASIPVESYALNKANFEAVTWKFRGWSWVDPTKEVNAYKEAVKAGFMTVSKVINLTGGGDDVEDVIAERKRELEMFDEAEIELDTTVPEPVEPAEAGQPAAAAAPAGDGAGNATEPELEDAEAEDAPAVPARVLKMRTA